MQKSELREKNRRKAIQVMKKCMLKYGIAATTKDLVAKKSNLSMTSIVRYFRTKDNMVATVCDEISKSYLKIYSVTNSLLDNSDIPTSEIVKGLFKQTIDSFEKNPDIFLLHSECVLYMCRRGEEGKKMYEKYICNGPLAEIITKVFERAVKDGTMYCYLPIEEEVRFLINSVSGVMSNIGCIVKCEKTGDVNIKREYLARVFTMLYEKYIGGVNEFSDNLMMFYLNR